MGKDANGNVATPDPDNFHDEGMVVYVTHLFQHCNLVPDVSSSVPAPFPCEFVPRDPEVLSILAKAHNEVLGSD